MRIPKFIGESGLAPNLCKPSAYPSVVLADNARVQGDLGGYLQTTTASAFNRLVASSTIFAAGFAAPFTAAANDSKPPAATQPVAQVASASAAATKPASVTPAGVKWDDVKVPVINATKDPAEDVLGIARAASMEGVAVVVTAPNHEVGRTTTKPAFAGLKLAIYQGQIPVSALILAIDKEGPRKIEVFCDGISHSYIVNPHQGDGMTVFEHVTKAWEDSLTLRKRRLQQPGVSVALNAPAME